MKAAKPVGKPHKAGGATAKSTITKAKMRESARRGPAKVAAATPSTTRRNAATADERRALREVDPALFEALSEGERAAALRILTEDRRLANMAKVARYRVI